MGFRVWTPLARFAVPQSLFANPQPPFMSEVQLTEDDRIDVALKRFKRLVQRSGLLQELRRRREYVKPSEARQRKAAAAKRRNRKKRRPEG